MDVCTFEVNSNLQKLDKMPAQSHQNEGLIVLRSMVSIHLFAIEFFYHFLGLCLRHEVEGRKASTRCFVQ